MRRVCVFAGSGLGSRQVYQQAARALGKELARRGLGLVYGGANVGLMGEVANAVLHAGGEVIGVVPRRLWSQEANHSGLTVLYEVGTMHERKALMAELADGFIALPGGLGTFDELFETLTWAQLGLHTKPIGLLNIAEYFKPLLKLVASALREGFISRDPPVLVSEGEDVAMLLDQLIQARQAVLNAPGGGGEQPSARHQGSFEEARVPGAPDALLAEHEGCATKACTPARRGWWRVRVSRTNGIMLSAWNHKEESHDSITHDHISRRSGYEDRSYRSCRRLQEGARSTRHPAPGQRGGVAT